MINVITIERESAAKSTLTFALTYQPPKISVTILPIIN